MREIRKIASAIAVIAVALTVPAAAEAQNASDGWRFALTPYVWLPSISGTLKFKNPPGGAGSVNVDFDIGVDDYISDLNFALMLTGEARKDRWSLATDVIYVDLSGDSSSVRSVNFGGTVVSTTLNGRANYSLRGIVWTLAAGYEAVQTPALSLDAFGGFRYVGVKASTSWQLAATITGPLGGSQVFPQSGSVSQSEDLLDGIVGVRGRIRLGEGGWSIPYYADIGTGSSNLTWQAVLGVAYGFGWGEVALAYRYLHYDLSNDKLVQDLSFGGPQLGVTFRF